MPHGHIYRVSQRSLVAIQDQRTLVREERERREVKPFLFLLRYPQ